MKVHIIRADGTEESVEAKHSEIADLIGADCLDGFSLRDGRYVWVDDMGHAAEKPINVKATKLYHGICKPGTTHQIVGDVAIIEDAS